MLLSSLIFFFFNDTATTEIYTLSLHDALPILTRAAALRRKKMSSSIPEALTAAVLTVSDSCAQGKRSDVSGRSEEHTSELQSQSNLVCRLLLEKKNIHREPAIILYNRLDDRHR